MGDTALLIVAGAVLTLIIVYGAYVVIRGRKSEIEERLGRYALGPDVEAGERVSPLGEKLERALAGRGITENIRTQLARADVKLTVSEFMAVNLVIIILAAGGAYIISRGNAFMGLIAGAVALLVPRSYLAIQQRKRVRAFNDHLSDTINLLVNSVRAGYSVLQAMEAVAEEMAPPTSEEFHRVVREVQLGLTMEEALQNMLRRVPSDDLDLMITAMNVQREVGGNLAEVLDAISFTIRERVRILGEIRALTAQGRYAGYIVSLLPVFVSVVIFFINPEFTEQLTEKECGWILIGIAVVLEVLGYIVIQRIVNIEV